MTIRTKTNLRRTVAFAAAIALAWPVITSTAAAQATDIDTIDSATTGSVITLSSEDASGSPSVGATDELTVNTDGDTDGDTDGGLIHADEGEAVDSLTPDDATENSGSPTTGSDSVAAVVQATPSLRASTRATGVTVAKWVTDPTSVVIGATVRWHLSVVIPVLGPDEEEFTQFSFTDQLPASFEYYSTVVISPQMLPVSGGYRYDADTHTITFGTDSNPSAEFQKWLLSRQGQTIEVSVAGRVVAVGDSQNTLSASINGTTETASASSRWGKLRISKTDLAGNGLANAEFQVFTNESDALAGTNPINFPTKGTTLITDTTGMVSVPGLYVGNATQDTRDYWLRETAAPEDFVISGGNVGDEPGVWKTTLDGTTTSPVTLPIVNQKLNPDPEPEPEPTPTPQPPVPEEEIQQPPTSEVLSAPVPAADTPAADTPVVALAVTGSDARALLLTSGAALLLLALGATFVATHRKTRNTTA